MNQFVTDNLPLLIVGALIALAVLWWVLMATRRTRVEVDRRDTLDEGSAPAARNQALIDAPSAAAADSPAPVPPAVPEAVGGVGVAVAAAVEEAQVARAAENAGDDLTLIKGLGPRIAVTLAGMGITRFDQIAAWTEADIDRVDAELGRFQGRIRRDSWVDQARLLADGDLAGFHERFGAS